MHAHRFKGSSVEARVAHHLRGDRPTRRFNGSSGGARGDRRARRFKGSLGGVRGARRTRGTKGRQASSPSIHGG